MATWLAAWPYISFLMIMEQGDGLQKVVLPPVRCAGLWQAAVGWVHNGTNFAAMMRERRESPALRTE